MASALRACLRAPSWSQLVGLQTVQSQFGVIQTRNFYRMLNAVFNRPDKERIKEVGPEMACAQWLLRCGAHVRWQGSQKFHTDYNTLPTSSKGKYIIEEINADNAAVMEIGFVHFDGCTGVKKMRFHLCPYLEDASIFELDRLKDTLQHLEISSCGDVSDKGLASLTKLHLLQSLLMYDLPGVRDKQGSFNNLKKALPDCKIIFQDLDPPKSPPKS